MEYIIDNIITKTIAKTDLQGIIRFLRVQKYVSKQVIDKKALSISFKIM